MCNPDRVSTALCPQYKEVHHIEEKNCKDSAAELKNLAAIYKTKTDKCRQERAISEIDTLVLQKSDGKYVPFEKIDVKPTAIKLLTHRGRVIETIAKTSMTGIHFKSGDRVEFAFKTRGGRRTRRRRRTLRKNKRKRKRKTRRRGGGKKKKKKTRRRGRARRTAASRRSRRSRRPRRSRRRQRGGAGEDVVIKYKPESAETIETFKTDLDKHGWKHLIGAKPVIARPPPVVGEDIDQRASPVPPPPLQPDASVTDLDDDGDLAQEQPDDSTIVGAGDDDITQQDPGARGTGAGGSGAGGTGAGGSGAGGTGAGGIGAGGSGAGGSGAGGSGAGGTGAGGSGAEGTGTLPAGRSQVPKKGEDSSDTTAGDDSLLPEAIPVPTNRSNNCVPEKDRTMIVKIVMPTEGGIELGSGGATAARFRQHVHDAVQTTSTKKKKVVAKGIPVVKGTPVPESS